MILTFHLAGINNQNFLMRDEETGTYWQQISGLAVSGPLAGKRLKPVYSDELTYALWKSEQPQGTVLRDVEKYASEYSAKDWDVKMKKQKTVIGYAQPGVGDRDVMLGIRIGGASRAFPYEKVLEQKLVLDRVGDVPVMLMVGPDNQSVRAFRVNAGADFYRTAEGVLIDAETGSHWNFQGCVDGGSPPRGRCLEPVEAIKDYWFDWRHYNPGTTIYKQRAS